MKILSSLLNGAMLTGSVTRIFQNSRYFAVSSLEDEKLIKKQTCTKNEARANVCCVVSFPKVHYISCWPGGVA